MRRELSPESIAASTELMREIHHTHPDIEVRDEQIEALAGIRDDENAGDRTSLIVMPPGMGKTIVLAADTQRRLREQPDARGLFLCDNTEILGQARETFQKVVGGEYTYGLFNGQEKEFDAFSVLFASFQAMHGNSTTRWRDAFHRNEFTFGIVDEGHIVKARTYEPTTRYFNFAHLIGATATPDRHDTLDIRSIFGPETYSLPIEKAIARRRLAAVDYYVIADELVETGIVRDDHDTEYYLRDFNQSIFAPRRDEEIIRIAKEYGTKIKGRPIVMGFTESKNHASLMAEMWGEGAAAYHSGVTPRVQRRIMQQYRDGELDTLFTIDMATQGLNVPGINQILLLKGTDSKRVYLQQVGRGLRKTKEKKRVQILDFVNNAERLLMADRMWTRIEEFREGMPPDNETFEIDMSHVHFNESSRRALTILKGISQNVYRPDQAVPEGSLRASSLTRDFAITPAVLKAVASDLRIKPQFFPTQRGSQVPYYTGQDVVRIRNRLAQLFDRRS